MLKIVADGHGALLAEGSIVFPGLLTSLKTAC
jgi:hypothetical protein